MTGEYTESQRDRFREVGPSMNRVGKGIATRGTLFANHIGKSGAEWRAERVLAELGALHDELERMMMSLAVVVTPDIETKY